MLHVCVCAPLLTHLHTHFNTCTLFSTSDTYIPSFPSQFFISRTVAPVGDSEWLGSDGPSLALETYSRVLAMELVDTPVNEEIPALVAQFGEVRLCELVCVYVGGAYGIVGTGRCT